MSIEDEDVLTAGERLEDEEDERLREGVRNSLLAGPRGVSAQAASNTPKLAAAKQSIKPD